MKDFEFYAGGIEDAILDALTVGMESTGVKTFQTYSGELDSESLKRALGEIAPKFPLVMVSYTDGTDTRMPSTAPVLGRSLHFRHDCTFAVICATNDARGENARRRGKLVGTRQTGAYTMISKVRELLSGLQIRKIIDETDIEMYGESLYLGEEVLLTNQPLIPVANEFIARLPNITAYAVIFETYFQWSSPDRSKPGIPVTEISVGLDSLNDAAKPKEILPGVNFN